MSDLPPVPPSPGVGFRRKGPQGLPTLPLSAFSAPNSSASDSFPIPESPSTTHPEAPIDAFVADPAAWASSAGDVLGKKAAGIVLTAGAEKAAEAIASFTKKDTSGPSILSVFVPLSTNTDKQHQAGVNYSVKYDGSPELAQEVNAALAAGKTVDIEIETDLRDNESVWDAFEEFLVKATAESPSGKIILSNILPPTDDLSVAIVKLLNHAAYRQYQSHSASLSLFSNLFLAFRPPSWAAPVPAHGTKDAKEWKRRIKMYLGPALEAFGFERIIFGSAPTQGSSTTASPSDWYELARESFAELGVEQDAIDAVFGGNAKRVLTA